MSAKVNPPVPVQAMGLMANQTDTLNKTIKVMIPIADIVSGILGFIPGTAAVQAGISLFRGELNTAKGVINATNVVERACDWGIEKNRNALLKRWEKVANRVALAAAQALETVLLIDKCSSGFFYQASMMTCNLPIFEVVKGLLYMMSAACGLLAAAKDVSAAYSTKEESEGEILKWKEIELLSLEDRYKEKSKRFKVSVLTGNINAKKAEIANYETWLKADIEIKKAQDELVALEKNLLVTEKYERYLGVVKEGSEGPKGIKDFKIKKYETRSANAEKIIEKSWLSIAVEVSKIFMISVGMSVVALSTFYPVLGGPVAKLVMSSCGLVAASLGLSKNIYTAVAAKPVKEPVFSATTA